MEPEAPKINAPIRLGDPDASGLWLQPPSHAALSIRNGISFVCNREPVCVMPRVNRLDEAGIAGCRCVQRRHHQDALERRAALTHHRACGDAHAV